MNRVFTFQPVECARCIYHVRTYNGPRNLVLLIPMFKHRSIIFSAFLLTTLSMASSIAASSVSVRNSVVTLSITRRLNTSNGTINILEHDRARAAALMGISASPLDPRGKNMPIINVAFNYVANVAIGLPSHSCKFNLGRELRLPMDRLIQTN